MRKPNRESRAVIVIVAAIAGALLAGALALASVSAAGDALDDAAALRSVESIIASHDTATLALSRAVLVADGLPAGIGSADDVGAAVDGAIGAIAETAVRFESLPSSLQDGLVDVFAAWSQQAGEVTSLAAGGETVVAADSFATTYAESSASFTVALVEERGVLAERIGDADGAVGIFIRVAGFAVLFLLPLAAILTYRISARRQLDTAVAQLDVRLEAERLATSSREGFFAGFADELRGPTAAIAEEAVRLGDDGVVARAQDLSERIEDLAVAAGDEPPELSFAGVPMEEQIDWVIERFAECEAAVGGTYGAGQAYGDEARVRQALRNLVSSALTRGSASIRIYGDVAGSYYVVSVEDDGPGVNDDVAGDLTAGSVDPTDELDLAVATRLATAMGGMLEHEKLVGRTALVLSIPIAAPAGQDELNELVVADR